MDAYIIPFALTFLFLGWVPAYLTYRRKMVRAAEHFVNETAALQYRTFKSAFEAGWEARAVDDKAIARNMLAPFDNQV